MVIRIKEIKLNLGTDLKGLRDVFEIDIKNVIKIEDRVMTCI